jgi:hypothetical protein
MGREMRKKIYKKAKMVMDMMRYYDGQGGYGGGGGYGHNPYGH